jgi:hypothetical protein
MNRLFYLFVSLIILSGCATKMAYLNTQKLPEEVKKDKTDCQSIVDVSDLKDSGSKQKKFDECMKNKGYNVVTEKQAEKIQGFNGLWIKSGIDFKSYKAIFIEPVDISQIKIKNNNIPDTKVTDEAINNLGDEMFKRFSKILGIAMPVISDKKDIANKKVLCLSLKLNNICQTNVGANIALAAVGELIPVPAPLPDAPEGAFSFAGIITDSSGKEKLIIFSDEVKSDRNSSLIGTEKFSHWQRAYNIMDYWADRLAALLAKERGQDYKSQLRIRIL